MGRRYTIEELFSDIELIDTDTGLEDHQAVNCRVMLRNILTHGIQAYPDLATMLALLADYVMKSMLYTLKRANQLHIRRKLNSGESDTSMHAYHQQDIVIKQQWLGTHKEWREHLELGTHHYIGL
jgi:hypothetical protein